MSHWLTLIFLLPVSVFALGAPRYECGEHGRFEYCIDGVPGCIVGCHCHPGFYFDTETKICEPNAKLVEEYRRLYAPEPTRVQIPMTPPELSETLPTPTTMNPLDNQVDAIAKDTDDLGDWLYNQFFKNIGNEVTNSSKKEPELFNTRRSGSRFGMKKTKKSKKPKSTKKINIKNKNLRRKLFRITEDDSLFNTDEDEDDDDDDDNSDYDSSDSDDSDVSSCNKKSGSNKTLAWQRNPNEKEHGHRKFVMINKKPKAPLPSFIFLPNLETPFFPPIGLPPPPAVPMYPMIPVPPMPVFPFQGTTTSGSAGSTTTTTQSTTTSTTTTTTSTSTTTDTQKTDDDPNKQMKLRHRTRNQPRNQMLEALRSNMKFPGFMNKGPNDILLPFGKGKQRPNSPRKHFLHRKPPHVSEDSEMPTFDEPPKKIEDDLPHHDVNFKYLSQLIHKVDPNMTHEDLNKNLNIMNSKHTVPQRRTFESRYYNQLKDYTAEQLEKYPSQHYSEIQPPHRLSDQHEFMHSSPLQYQVLDENNKNDKRELDDLYYANLGQQIASFIRKIDHNVGERPVDIEIESHRGGVTESVVVNENSYSPRSFWERSVRSPLNYFHPYYTNEFDYTQRNYENLLNIESKIETIATTEKSLSLREIENVVFLMDKSKSKYEKKRERIKVSTTKKPHISTETLNINLLPRHSELFNSAPKSFEYYTLKTHKPILKNTEKVETKKVERKKSNITEELINRRNLHYNLRGILMNNFRNAPFGNDKPMLNNDTDLVQLIAQRLLFDAVTSNKRQYDNRVESSVRRPSPLPSNMILNHIKTNIEMPSKQRVRAPLRVPTQKQLTSLDRELPFSQSFKNNIYQPPQTAPLAPALILSPQTVNNGINRNVRLGYERGRNIMLPFDNNLLKLRFNKPSQSYFHHEINHFDYFD